MTEESKVELVVLALINGRDDADRLYHAVVCEQIADARLLIAHKLPHNRIDHSISTFPRCRPQSQTPPTVSATSMTIRLHSVPESGRWRGHRREYARHDAAYQ